MGVSRWGAGLEHSTARRPAQPFSHRAPSWPKAHTPAPAPFLSPPPHLPSASERFSRSSFRARRTPSCRWFTSMLMLHTSLSCWLSSCRRASAGGEQRGAHVVQWQGAQGHACASPFLLLLPLHTPPPPTYPSTYTQTYARHPATHLDHLLALLSLEALVQPHPKELANHWVSSGAVLWVVQGWVGGWSIGTQ